MEDRPFQHARGPWLTAWKSIEGHWVYQWWDSVDSYVTGEPPTRSKRFQSVHGILAALLSDAARVRELPNIHEQSGDDE